MRRCEMSRYTLEFYRDDQASSYEQAKKDGAVREIWVEEPELFKLYPNPFNHGQIADLIEVIDKATDMMEGGAVINYYLTEDGVVTAKEEDYRGIE
jgi:hypothetical protein